MHHKSTSIFLKASLKKNWSQNKKIFLLAALLITVSVIGRIIPHPWNMTPVIGATIFAGVTLGKRWALAIPLVSMFVSDMVIGFYNWKFMAVVYGAMLVIGLASYFTKNKKGTTVFLSRPLAASVFFFLTTNAAVCFFGTMYPHTGAGLLASYISGLPFFGHDLLGNLLYVSVFFGVYEFAKNWSVIKSHQVALSFEQSAK